MSKSKTKKVKLKTTPHEELLKELEYLRAENAYLKKLQALVEERIVRESGKEPKPLYCTPKVGHFWGVFYEI